MSFSITDIKPLIGAEIKADKETLLSGKYAAEIREALEARGCFVIREINFTGEEQLAFTKTLGRVIDEGEGGIYKVTLDTKENEHADYLRGAFYWHMDGSTLDVPILASILNGFKPSETGGNTEFCSTYVGYEDLPEEDKQAYEGLRVVHSLAAAQYYVHPEPTLEQISTWSMMPSRSHPLVWKHASGRKSLVIGATASHIEGMGFEEGRALLHKLRIHCTQPKYVYSHQWTKGDLVAWDNTGTLHRATEYPLDSGRMMHRTKLEGEEPIA
ncbi:TauD/TfdA family dioxygenase [Aestuariicella hydrocarbonica]|uniref:TauD/TfdA family dioxygenase n=1 Tax=Pseudomaricurvus hydrocarbonicus TaxID=1470433 RepID=A0A9E5JW09_9GAMM|nr:TauD/TfdA family dioxygenase [Aestuariicella hydrocarbonica]NHO65920.1 TauD/TfdA family dioxygenase [Aestuariicella hydrocarbonica]